MAFGLNKEVERRATELIAINDREAGGTLRIGGGWRSDARATAEFYRRYTRTTQTARKLLTDKYYDGTWWSLNAGEIGCATPGNSYHTTMPPDALTGDTGAVAIDWVNEIHWMNANCHRVGLRHFAHIPGEAHHTQPVEYPGSRREYDPAKHKLTIWPLTTPTTGDDDDMQHFRAVDIIDGKRYVDPAVIEVVGRDACWLDNGHANKAFIDADMPPKEIGRDAYARFHFDGPEPVYEGILANWPQDARTKRDDFMPRELAA